MFKYAIVRKPGKNFSEGLTKANLGKPDFKKALEQHDNYCEVLEKCGVKLKVLEADPRFPDCPFVEDTAIVTEEFAIITNLGAKSRRGEEEKIRETLREFRTIELIKSPGIVEGGDILRINNHFYIGLSKRTNEEGAEQLSKILAKYGFTSSSVLVKNVLHLKTSVTFIGNNNIVATDEFANRDEFKKFNIIEVDKKESDFANCLLVNDFLLIPEGFSKSKEKIQALGYKILEIEISEFQKMGGGLTCLSILF